MAILIEGARTWWHDPTQFNITTADAALLSDGRIAVGVAGSDGAGDGLVSLGILNQTSDRLTGLVSTIYPDAAGGLPVTAVRTLDLQAGPAGTLSATLYLPESATGDDTNAALLVQRYAGTATAGPALAVDPAATAKVANPGSAIVTDGAGVSRVFFTDGPGGTASDGIRMAIFDATGAATGAPVTVVADHPAGGILPIEANPILVDAAAMANGNIALTWTESSAFAAPGFGQPRVMFQMIAPDGAAAGGALEIDGTSARLSQILTLKGGGMVVAWLDSSPGDRGIWKAQMLTATGALSGSAFELSSSITTQEADLSLVALDNGGWAAAWRDMSNDTHLGRMFDARGRATGGDFRLLDSAADFIGPAHGLVAKGNELIAWMIGLDPAVGAGAVMQGQTFSTASSLGVRLGLGAGDDPFAGAGLDDWIGGGAGRDSLSGGAGGDTLLGGDGRDVLSGGDGIDQITGGRGADRLSGGAGPDSFIFTAASAANDRIADFDGAEGDRLILTSAGFGGATAVLSGAVVDDAHAGLFFDTATGELTYDADGAGAAARLLVARLAGVTALAADDVLFV